MSCGRAILTIRPFITLTSADTDAIAARDVKIAQPG
jgi:hypothetical protein